MLRTLTVLLCLSASLAALQPVTAADSDAARNATRDKLRKLLDSAASRSDINATFQQASKQPYNFVASMEGGMKNVDSLEVVITVSAQDTIAFRVYPHYKGGYINLDKVKDGPALMRKLLQFSNSNFLFWGADNTNDVFCGYTVTLESGFPDEAIMIVLRSMRSTDGFVGEVRPYIDGSSAVK